MHNEVKSGSGVKRHLIAALILPGFIAYIYLLPPMPYFLILLSVVGMIAMWEFFVMYKVPARLCVPAVIVGGALFVLLCLFPEYMLEGMFVFFLLLLLLRLFFAETPSGCMTEIGPLGVGIIYVTVFLSFQWMIRNELMGLEYIFLLYCSVWFSDSLAYYIGTLIGRKKLCPSISPKKTVAGAYGSILGGMLGAVTVKCIFSVPDFSVPGAVVIGAVMGLSAMTGDLIESMFKRDAGIKDSSNFIPGHGGVLDKLDGLLVAGPVLYFIVRCF